MQSCVSSVYQWYGTPNLVKIDPMGTMYCIIKIPQLRWVAEDEWTPKLMEKLLFDRKDWNHFSTVPMMPKESSRRDKIIPQSKAIASVVSKMSFKAFRRADSMLPPHCFLNIFQAEIVRVVVCYSNLAQYFYNFSLPPLKHINHILYL